MRVKVPDVEVELTFLTTADGGRSYPVTGGYRPFIRYNLDDWSCMLRFPKDWIEPGETTTASLNFLHPDEHKGKVEPGMTFELKEGRRVVARGRIIASNLKETQTIDTQGDKTNDR